MARVVEGGTVMPITPELADMICGFGPEHPCSTPAQRAMGHVGPAFYWLSLRRVDQSQAVWFDEETAAEHCRGEA